MPTAADSIDHFQLSIELWLPITPNKKPTIFIHENFSK